MSEIKSLSAALRFDPTHPAIPGAPEDGAKFFPSEAEARVGLSADANKINELQDMLFAEGKRSLLVILQGMDTSGKDGTIRGVFGETGPLGVEVTAFRQPSVAELAQDYLWRVHKAAPQRGKIGIFNRSHYEDVLVVKVKGYAAAPAIEKRYAQINDFERILHENGTRILKFMLNISFTEQAERLQARIDDANKRWKFNPGDLEDRVLWPEFMAAYQTMLMRTSSDHAPWHVIPADRKWARNALIARIIRETLEEMAPAYPEIAKPEIKIS